MSLKFLILKVRYINRKENDLILLYLSTNIRLQTERLIQQFLSVHPDC